MSILSKETEVTYFFISVPIFTTFSRVTVYQVKLMSIQRNAFNRGSDQEKAIKKPLAYFACPVAPEDGTGAP